MLQKSEERFEFRGAEKRKMSPYKHLEANLIRNCVMKKEMCREVSHLCMPQETFRKGCNVKMLGFWGVCGICCGAEGRLALKRIFSSLQENQHEENVHTCIYS